MHKVTVVVFVIAKYQKKKQFVYIECVNKLWTYIHTMEYSEAIKKKGHFLWTNVEWLQDILFSEKDKMWSFNNVSLFV